MSSQISMKQGEEILQKIGRDTGFRVPDGYFETVYDTIGKNLPKREEPVVVPMTTWQKLKPYVYLAAMFGGIWCMVHMVHMVMPQDVSLENPPEEVLAELENEPESFEELYRAEFAVEDIELESQVLSEYGSFEELKKNIDLELEPQYADMKVKMPEKMQTQSPQMPDVAQNTKK